MHGIARDTVVDGRYRAEKRLGSGGMAEVWCAEDDVLGRRVALKLLGSRFAEDDEFRERFRREARAAAGLTHPNIVGIFDRGDWDGTPYIAMELVDGRTLKDLVRERGPLPPDVATNIMLQILSALGYAHRRGIVHRDVKPDNILFDEDENAVITDFGIATARFHGRLTGTGRAMGTPHYMSPEQAMGKMVDGRSDLYAVGVMLYEMLLGFPPFDGADSYSVGYKHVHEAPVAPDVVDSRTPKALAEIVMRCLAKNPADRYQRGNDLADALIGYLAAAADAPAYRSAWLSRRTGSVQASS
jgi:eukaryotic-like serine/threonine-protein kinase